MTRGAEWVNTRCMVLKPAQDKIVEACTGAQQALNDFCALKENQLTRGRVRLLQQRLTSAANKLILAEMILRENEPRSVE